MKTKIIGLFCLVSVLFSCVNSETKKDEKINFSEYGPKKVDESKALKVANMIADFEANGSKRNAYTLEANIEEVCSKAGCWINIKTVKDETMMVRFKDHFTIPPKTKIGTKAYLHGDLYADTVTVDLLQHFAEDAGKSPEEIAKITEPKITLSFEADGIKFESKK